MIAVLDLRTKDRDAIENFYLSLAPSIRRRRFGGTLADEVIKRWCAGLDQVTSLFAAITEAGQIRLLIEAHAQGNGWRTAEVSVCCVDSAMHCSIVSGLRTVACLCAERGCSKLILDEDLQTLEPLLHDLGPVHADGGELHLTLRHPAQPRQATRNDRSVHGR